MILNHKDQIVVVGSGLAGMLVALQLSPLPVILITQGKLGQQTSSVLAQGGIAAAYYEPDHVASHIQDTMSAGAGLNDIQVVHKILSMGKEAIDLLKSFYVPFDCDEYGKLRLGLEAAHTYRRIFHVNGDTTGKGIIDSLCQVVQSANHITVIEDTIVKQLLHDAEGQQIVGVMLEHQQTNIIYASHVILATGGIGGLYQHSTNPLSNFGQGLALAMNVGAVLADLEFIQFHPTALNTKSLGVQSFPTFPKVLISEAVRGEGAILINEKNERFLKDVQGQELASRDIVARAIFKEIQNGRKVFLDARQALGTRFASRFPNIDRLCKQVGIDPAQALIPVQPVEHFHMGGIAANADGKTSVTGLWAIGECASTGLHGANRLASNSLLEATVMAMRAARSIIENPRPYIQSHKEYKEFSVSRDVHLIQPMMQSCVGILRNETSLIQAVKYFLSLVNSGSEHIHYPAQIALVISVSALLRKESRGAHSREDYPDLLPNAQRSLITYDHAIQLAKQV